MWLCKEKGQRINIEITKNFIIGLLSLFIEIKRKLKVEIINKREIGLISYDRVISIKFCFYINNQITD